jgi:hypothetical protein
MTTTRGDALADATPEALLELGVVLLYQTPLGAQTGVFRGPFPEALAALELNAIDLRVSVARLIPHAAVNGHTRQLRRHEDALSDRVEEIGPPDAEDR